MVDREHHMKEVCAQKVTTIVKVCLLDTRLLMGGTFLQLLLPGIVGLFRRGAMTVETLQSARGPRNTHVFRQVFASEPGTLAGGIRKGLK